MSAMSTLDGGVFASAADDDYAELRSLIDDIGSRSFDARLGHRVRPERFDDALWRNLEDTGLARLTSTPELDAGPTELAVVLSGLARHAGAVPIAETDALGAWLAEIAGLPLPEKGPLTVAVCDATVCADRIHGTAADVPWARAATAIILAASTSDGFCVARVDPAEV